MRRIHQTALATAALTMLLSLSAAQAQDLVSQFPQQVDQVSYECGCDDACDSGCDDGCDSCCDSDCWHRGHLAGTSVYFGADAWASRLDDDDSNNFGFRLALNQSFGSRSIRGQAGFALGLYDLKGHESGDTTDNEEQLFVTLGAYHRADYCCGERCSWGLVWDILHTENFGEEHNQSMLLHQARYRVGYAMSECNEVGIWGTFRTSDNEPFVTNNAGTIYVNSNPQASIYWEHDWDYGAKTMVYAGWADQPLDFIFGFNGEVPLSCNSGVYGNFMYGNPSTHAGDSAPNGVAQSYSEASWNVGFGFVYYFGGRDHGCCNADIPYLPVADNSSFNVSGPVGAL